MDSFVTEDAIYETFTRAGNHHLNLKKKLLNRAYIIHNSYTWNSPARNLWGGTQIKQSCNMKDSEELFQQVLRNEIPNYMYQFMLLYWQLAELYPAKAVPYFHVIISVLTIQSNLNILGWEFQRLVHAQRWVFFSSGKSVLEKKTHPSILPTIQFTCKNSEHGLWKSLNITMLWSHRTQVSCSSRVRSTHAPRCYPYVSMLYHLCRAVRTCQYMQDWLPWGWKGSGRKSRSRKDWEHAST